MKANSSNEILIIVKYLFYLSAIATNFCSPLQRTDWRIGNIEIPAAWHSGRIVASTASDIDTEISGKQRNDSMVPHVYVGRHLFTVSSIYIECNFAFEEKSIWSN